MYTVTIELYGKTVISNPVSFADACNLIALNMANGINEVKIAKVED